ncbi:phage tail tape measure protein [Hymenobacter sediminis]|uniref:phage tail tape measure protein n=1 Tax=Hymenobacter sediminis TaxID=2218621 RepID=UPI00138FB102|nr:phage tail tape measure protein [Hymenobacter sediminis]
MDTSAILDFNDYIRGGQALQEASQSVRALKRDVTAFSKAVDQDGDRIKAGLQKVADAIRDIQTRGGNLNISSEADRQTLRDLIKEVARLKTEQAGLKSTGDGVAAAQRNVTQAASLYTKELKEQREALLAARKANDIEGQKRSAIAIQGLVAQQKEFSKAVRGTSSELTAAAGSYNAANQELTKLRAEYRALGGVLDGANPKAAELEQRIQQLDAQLKASDKTLGQTYRNVGNYTQSILDAVSALEKEKRELEAGAAALRTQAKASGLSAEQQQNLQQELQETDQKLEKVNKDLEGYGVKTQENTSLTAQAGSSFKKYLLTLALATVSFEALAGAAQQVFRNNVEFSDQLADVRKTTGLTADEADRLAESLKKIDTRTSLAGLLDIAKVGGQLGIAKEDILGFTKAVDVAVQALGDDFSGGAEQIADELGKISNVFRKELGPDVAQNLLSIGSAVNEIGAQGAATAPFLTDVALRVGAVAAQTGVGLKNVLAYAAVLEETGSTSERAGTSLNRLFSTLSTKTQESFRIAQKANPALTLREFTKLVNTDFNAAVQLFLKGLNAGGKTTTQLSKLLSTLKLDSGEAKSAIITLAQNTDLFAQRQAVANQQLTEATSLAQEAAIKNDNLAGSVNKLVNETSNFFTSGAAGKFLKWVVDLVRESGGLALVAAAFESVGQGIDFVREKTGFARKEQDNFVQGVVSTITSLNKQAIAQQKLLDSYTQLSEVKKRSTAQDLELARLQDKLVTQFGTSDKQRIQNRINAIKGDAEANKQELVRNLELYTQLVDQTSQEVTKLQQEATKSQQAFARFGLSPEGQKNLQEAARNTDILNKVQGLSFPKAQVDAAKDLNKAQERLTKGTERLTEAERQRALLAAALAKLQPAVAKAVEDTADAEEESLDVFNKAAKERAAARRQQLENDLAAQQRLIEQTKKFQEEQGRLFEARVINEDQYAQAVIGTQDIIMGAERESARIRLEIADASQQELVAQADEELNAVKRKRKVSAEEIEDAERAHSFRKKAIALKYKSERLKIEQELQDKLVEYNKPLDIKAPLDNVKFKNSLENVQRDFARGEELALKRMQARADKEKETAEKSLEKTQKIEAEKQRIREGAMDVAMQATQAFFNFQQQRDQQAISNLEAQKQRELDAAGDNAELRAQIEEQYQERIKKAKQKAARDERTAALFEVAINTAIAVSKTIAEFGFTPASIPFVALAAATGAIQIAAILAAPLPQYFKGRNGGRAEWAEVAERGPELIEGPAGVRLAEKRQITFLEAGATVHTADKTRELLRASEAPPLPRFAESMGAASQQLQGATAKPMNLDELIKGQQQIVSAIKNQRTHYTNYNDSGAIERAVLQAGSLTYYANWRMGKA